MLLFVSSNSSSSSLQSLSLIVQLVSVLLLMSSTNSNNSMTTTKEITTTKNGFSSVVTAFVVVQPPARDCWKLHSSSTTGKQSNKDGQSRNNKNVFFSNNNKNNKMNHVMLSSPLSPTKVSFISSSSSSSSLVSLSLSTSSGTSYGNNDSTIKIIIAGAPASGKGTQCEYITKKYGIVHLSTGDMLREAVSANTPVGMLAKQYMDSGKLVPDDVIISIVQDRLKEQDCIEQGWLLDGFPRTKAQAVALEQVGIVADIFLFLNVPDEIIIERVIGRRTDPVTNKIYHLTYSPPPTDDSELLSRLVHRSDDTAEKIIVRLQQFHDNVNSVLDTYSDIMVTIDGNQSPTIVSEQIMNSIEQRIGMKQTKKTVES